MSESTQTTPGQNPNSNVVALVACTLAGLVLGALGALTYSKMSGGDNPVVARYAGKSIKASEVFGSIKTRLYDLENEVYRTKEQAINDFVDQRLLENEAKKQNLAVEQLLEKETGGAVGDVDDKEVEGFLSSKGLSLSDPRIRKEDVKEYLKYRKRVDKRQGYVAKLRESSKVEILVKEPESPRVNAQTDGYPSWGNPKAKVTVIEFSDYQCPYCSKAVPTIDRLKQEYGQDKIRIVFRDMPILRAHPRALPAALAAHCANDQGKFWEMHNQLFANQGKLEDADLKSYAKGLSLDEKKFAECYDSKKYQALIDKSLAEAQSLGISATPTFVVNGQIIEGAQNYERFKEKIDRALR